MLFGLSIGLAVALVVYLKSGSIELPALPTEQQTLTDVDESADAPIIPSDQRPPASSTETPAPEDDVAELGFYDQLANAEVVVSEEEFDFGGTETLQQVVIQAGSFPTEQSAESRRASLALLGLESFIEVASVNGVTYHRVIIGPYSERGEIGSVLRRLRQARIDTMVVVAD